MAKPFDPKLQLSELSSAFPDYTFVSFLGDGGQATVFRAIANSNKTEVAIKVYSPFNLLKRAEMEVEKLNRTNSPYLAKVVEYGTYKIRNMDCYCVITKYEKGRDLKQILNNNTLSIEETKILLQNMLSAINELWRMRVVHCDIKPANILYLENGSFKLIDLGFAKHLDIESMTAFGTIFGTQGYMAPEQWNGRRNVTVRADIFSLGIVAYEALSGIHPFWKNQMLICEMYQPRPIEQLANININFANIINSMVQPNVLKRPSSCQHILDVLECI